MAARALVFVSVVIVLSFYNGASAEDVPSFPTADEFDFAFYSTEVQLTDVIQETTAYATEYFDKIYDKGVVKVYFQGELESVYYDNSTSEITEVVDSYCKSTPVDAGDSEYAYIPLFYGWLNKYPLVIGPSASLWYAQGRRNAITYAGREAARDINCDKFVLRVESKTENLTYEYYFAPQDWNTPYKFQKLRVPIRVRITGKSGRYSGNAIQVDVHQVTDFAYFKPSIDDFNNFLPPLGLGCKFKAKTDSMPPVPKVFQYSAEVVDLLAAEEHEDVEIQFQKTWYDHTRLLARRDKYSRKGGFKSFLYDFKTGTQYEVVSNGSCIMGFLSGEFIKIDYSATNRMKTPEEALNLDGEFYEMGKREVRGLTCDVYESMGTEKHYNGRLYDKLVVTAYFTEDSTKVGVNGNTESRIPIFYIITGYDDKSKKTLQLQYNIFEFNDIIWPEMYSSFRLDRCFSKAESKAYFVLVMDVPAKVAALLESQDQLVKTELRSTIAIHAKVPEMRIPFLKVDYKPTGVFTTGVILDRPPALVQFEYIVTEPTITRDNDLKEILEADNEEKCAFSCVDYGGYPCKGFYYCGRACFLKSNDVAQEGDGEPRNLGECALYIRAEIESTNFRQAYLIDALGNLETAVLNGTVSVRFPIPSGTEIVAVQDIIIGDGPYTGVDAGDKPFTLSTEFRKLDASLETTRNMEYVGSLHDCYKKCKESGSLCSSFSYCPDSVKDNKECMISTTLVVKGVTSDTELVADKNCNIYHLKYADYFTPYPERVSLLEGDRRETAVPTMEKCAEICRMEKNFKCRGFEYCRSRKLCTLHKRHILDLATGEPKPGTSGQCVHYAARYIADYLDMGGVLIDDNSNVRYETSLEECAKICSEDLSQDCKSFNFCPGVDFSDSTCALSTKLLRDDGITTLEKRQCAHYEKRSVVHDWDNSQASQLKTGGYTSKGFAGLVVGMLALGLILGALAFVLYSYMRSRSSGEGMAVRFMKNES